MRNRIAHGYDTVDNELVFKTVDACFPRLAQALKRELDRVG